MRREKRAYIKLFLSSSQSFIVLNMIAELAIGNLQLVQVVFLCLIVNIHFNTFPQTYITGGQKWLEEDKVSGGTGRIQSSKVLTACVVL